jgi:hypothetical protein
VAQQAVVLVCAAQPRAGRVGEEDALRQGSNELIAYGGCVVAVGLADQTQVAAATVDQGGDRGAVAAADD